MSNTKIESLTPIIAVISVLRHECVILDINFNVLENDYRPIPYHTHSHHMTVMQHGILMSRCFDDDFRICSSLTCTYSEKTTLKRTFFILFDFSTVTCSQETQNTLPMSEVQRFVYHGQNMDGPIVLSMLVCQGMASSFICKTTRSAVLCIVHEML